jgi:hypothetical protein
MKTTMAKAAGFQCLFTAPPSGLFSKYRHTKESELLKLDPLH